MTDYKQLTRNGLWSNNVIFSQLLALCPLLAVTSSVTNGMGMGLATTVVLVSSGLVVALFRHITTPEIRIPVFVLIIASLVTLVDMSMNAWLHDLHKVLGLFIPLIVTNCAILGRAEAFASKNNAIPSLYDGLMMGLGFTLALMILGAVREVLGTGTLFANASLMFGSAFKVLELTVIPDYAGFLLMILPPGGFLALGFLLAGKRQLDKALARRQTQAEPGPAAETAAPA